MPTIQDVIDKAKVYLIQGVSPDEAVRLALATTTESAARQKNRRGYVAY